MNGRRVAVTGAGGFIASHLVEALVHRGASVKALVHYNAMGDVGNLARLSPNVRLNVEVVFGDICDSDFINHFVQGASLVYHLAALIAIPYSYLAPRSYLRTNAEGTLNVLEACRRSGVERIVHTSTSEVYGSAIYVPIDEKHPLQGQSPYSASKIAADKVAESYYKSFDTPVVTVRPFNTYGPRQSARAFIPTIIAQALAGREVKLGATTPVRDLTFATDTAAGFIAAATSPNVIGQTVNLGVGSGQAVGEVAQMILDIVGVDAQVVLDESRIRPKKSEVDCLISDNRLFNRLSGWTPEVNLDEGLRRTVDYFREFPPSDVTRYVV